MFIATAAYSFHANYTHSLAAAVGVMAQEGIPVDVCHIAEHCHVDDARNAMVRQFLMSKASHLIFIDNDVGFPTENLVRLARINPEVDMVAGVYPLKEDSEGYPVRLKDGIELRADENGLVEVEGLPTGFLRISRRCIEEMIERFGHRKFYGRGQSHDDPPHVVLFERTYENGTRYSGDYAFCEKWKLIGGKLFVDPEMSFTHSGTHEWSGTLGDHWRREYGVTELRFKAAIEAMRAGKFNAEVITWLREGWNNPFSANPNTLVACWHAAKKAKEILETGSGLTTLVMALANPDALIFALEAEPHYATHLRERLDTLGVMNVCIHCAPLKDGWYDFRAWADYGLVLLDGPNRSKGDRNQAFDKLGDSINNAVVIMDDAEDETLLNGFKAWAEQQGRMVNLIGLTQKTTAISKPA